MKSLLIINSAPFTQEFVSPIIDLFLSEGISYNLVNYTDLPEYLDNYGGVIISASPMGDDIINKQLPYYQWIKTYTKPLIGSCHGHQLLSVIYGGMVMNGHESEEGIHPIELIKDDKLFEGISKIYQVEQRHIKSVTLPINFELLARSSICKNQIMKHHSRPFYSCQFHVEKSPEILMNFVKLCLPKVHNSQTSKISS